MNKKSGHQNRSAGFTLVELMVVIGILVVLMSILIPAIAGVRKRGYEVRTRALMQKIASACQVYMGDWHSAPGILPESQLYQSGGNVNLAVTSTENLTLSLLGGLTTTDYKNFTFNASSSTPLTTNGPLGLNQADPKRYNSYIDYVSSEMDWVPGNSNAGNYKALYNGTATDGDSAIPEFLDGYPDPKPIIYMRAHVGAPAVIDDNTSDTLAQQNNPSQYRTIDFTIYSGDSVGAPQPHEPYALAFTGSVPVDQRDSKHFLSWYDAFRNEGMTQIDASGVAAANSAEIPKGKDGFILIAAGSSRAWLGKDAIIVSN